MLIYINQNIEIFSLDFGICVCFDRKIRGGKSRHGRGVSRKNLVIPTKFGGVSEKKNYLSKKPDRFFQRHKLVKVTRKQITDPKFLGRKTSTVKTSGDSGKPGVPSLLDYWKAVAGLDCHMIVT